MMKLRAIAAGIMAFLRAETLGVLAFKHAYGMVLAGFERRDGEFGIGWYPSKAELERRALQAPPRREDLGALQKIPRPRPGRDPSTLS